MINIYVAVFRLIQQPKCVFKCAIIYWIMRNVPSRTMGLCQCAWTKMNYWNTNAQHQLCVSAIKVKNVKIFIKNEAKHIEHACTNGSIDDHFVSLDSETLLIHSKQIGCNQKKAIWDWL